MRKAFRGFTTVEVMVMLVGMTIVILASYGAKMASFKAYQDIIHRERAQLYAAETLEQFEAMRLTRIQQDYMRSWETFLGSKDDGLYQLVQSDDLSNLGLVPMSEIKDTDTNSIRYYDDDEHDGFYSRLERRIWLREIGDPEKRLVMVSIYWGIPGGYQSESFQQIVVQSLYSDHTASGFAL
ncbi:MAG: hypothetical protein U1C97_00995 [Candidatus Gracilibacteria bacterium]|nr:hypothetical protein [bacterium]MDZ4216878.1 hypothetical protein [Candidatus Gracilibacteria bacterium]